MAKKRRSYPKSANTKYKFDLKDNSLIKVKWTSPTDKKENTLDIRFDKNNSIKIKDNH